MRKRNCIRRKVGEESGRRYEEQEEGEEREEKREDSWGISGGIGTKVGTTEGAQTVRDHLNEGGSATWGLLATHV